MQTEDKIRAWLMTFPGLVRASSPQLVLHEAMALFTAATGANVDLPIFTDALWRAGYRADQIGPRWQLALPSKPLSDDSHYRALRHITR